MVAVVVVEVTEEVEGDIEEIEGIIQMEDSERMTTIIQTNHIVNHRVTIPPIIT